jgi:hypothetical protein
MGEIMLETVKTDSAGNELKLYAGGLVTLKLAHEQRERNLGTITRSVDGSVFYNKHVKEVEHIYRKLNAWGFHYAVLESLDPATTIRVISDVKVYSIKAKEALEVAKYLHFKNEGFEKQAFVELTKFKTMGLV